MVTNCMAKDKTSMESLLCDGYVEGVADLLSDGTICVPPTMQGKELVDVFVRYAAKHEDELHGPASRIIGEALKETYACSTQR